jgi:hypothetical protein
MKKTRKNVLIILSVIFVLLVAFAAIEMAGFRFFSDNALSVYIKDKDEKNVIKAPGWSFYYSLAELTDENNVKTGEIIQYVLPVKKYGILYKFSPEYDNDLVYFDEDGAIAGFISSFDGKGCKHNFLNIRSAYNYPSNWYELTEITVDGKKYDLYKASYFVTDSDFSKIKLGDYEYTVKRSSDWIDQIKLNVKKAGE